MHHPSDYLRAAASVHTWAPAVTNNPHVVSNAISHTCQRHCLPCPSTPLAAAQDEQKNLKNEYLRAQEEVKRIQSVPLVIGQFLEAIDENTGVCACVCVFHFCASVLVRSFVYLL